MATIGSVKRMSLGQFLGHTTRGGGNRGFLGKWNNKKHAKASPKGQVCEIDVLLNAAAGIAAVWQHPFKRLHALEKTEAGQKVTKVEIWGESFNCLEDEEVLRQQYFYTDTGERQAPPEICPVCRLLEWIATAIDAGELDWCAPAFKFEAVGVNTEYLYAGGVTGLFGSKDLTEDDKKTMFERTKITPRTAFQQNAMAGCKYVFCVADVGALQKGIQITTESQSLGQKVQDMIDKQMQGEGPTGNPFKHPYVVRWQFFPDCDDPKEKYQAFPVRSTPITPEMRQLVDAPPPDALQKALAYPNMTTLRATLQRHCVLPGVPWDEIFGPILEHCDEHGNVVVEGEEVEEDQGEGEGPGPVPGATVQTELATSPCDNCRQLFSVELSKCPHCGMEYDLVDDSAQSALAEPAPAPAAPAAPAPAPAPAPAQVSNVGPGTPLPAPSLPAAPGRGRRGKGAAGKRGGAPF